MGARNRKTGDLFGAVRAGRCSEDGLVEFSNAQAQASHAHVPGGCVSFPS